MRPARPSAVHIGFRWRAALNLQDTCAGSPDGLQGRSRGRMKQGTDVTSRIRKLPEEPGNYEIRCSSFWGGKQKQVHARRKLTIY